MPLATYSAMCVQALTWVPEEEREVQAALCRWTAAFSRALKCHLRVGCNSLGELQVWIGGPAVEWLWWHMVANVPSMWVVRGSTQPQHVVAPAL